MGKIMQREGQRQMSSRGEQKHCHKCRRTNDRHVRDIYACPVRWSASRSLRRTRPHAHTACIVEGVVRAPDTRFC
jgi:hypothetical protein